MNPRYRDMLEGGRGASPGHFFPRFTFFFRILCQGFLRVSLHPDCAFIYLPDYASYLLYLPVRPTCLTMRPTCSIYLYVLLALSDYASSLLYLPVRPTCAI